MTDADFSSIDAAAIIRDLMGSRLQESQIADPVHSKPEAWRKGA